MRRARGRVEPAAPPFPMLVTFGALAAAALLFLTNTAPALRERAALAGTAERMARVRADYVEQLVRLRRQHNSLAAEDLGAGPVDVQALLVAIDELGLTPAELLQLHPEDSAAESDRETVDRQRLRHVRGN